MAFLGYLIEASDRATHDDVCTLCGLCSDGIMVVVKFAIFGKGFVCDEDYGRELSMANGPPIDTDPPVPCVHICS